MGKEIILTTIKANEQNASLKKDSNGYYYVTLGALNTFNSANEFYALTQNVKDLFTKDSSVLMRRLKAGYLKGEVGHPKLEPGMSREQFFSRNMRIDERNVCVHIKEIVLEETDIDSGYGDGSKVVIVSGWVKPSGPHADALERDLENPDVNVAFSIRSFTSNKMVNGVLVKEIAQVITWDWVTEPGIAKANKWTKLGIESRDVCSMSLEDIAGSDDDEINECFNCSLENNDERDLVKELISNVSKTKEDKKSFVCDW